MEAADPVDYDEARKKVWIGKAEHLAELHSRQGGVWSEHFYRQRAEVSGAVV